MKYVMVTVLLALLLFLMAGCLKPQVLDGDGMEREIGWREFTLSQNSDVYEQNYCLTVVHNWEDSGVYLYVYAFEGCEYDAEKGILLKDKTVEAILSMNLGAFPDEVPVEDEEYEVLDGTWVSFQVIDESGNSHNKTISSEVAAELYALLAPYAGGK